MLSLLAAMILAGAAAGAPQRSFELSGQLDPPPPRATVTINGVDKTFTATAAVGENGQFRFRKLAAGAYILTAFAPGIGVTRRTIEVSPSLADSKGRINTTIPFAGSAISAVGPLARRSTVSVSELAIPKRARQEYEEAQKQLSRQDTAGAIKHLKQALELAPRFMMAWNELGTIEFRAGNWAAAETYFRKALELRPGALMVTLNLGSVLLYLRRYREALEYNRFAVERAPNNALANSQLGMNYFMLYQDDEALKYLRIAKGLDPSHYSNPQLALADIYLRRGDPAHAIGELEDFLTRHPDAPIAAKVRDQIARLKPRR